MEMADLILVNKADGDLKPAALRTMADYAGALRLLRRRPQDPEGFPKAMPVSALAVVGLTQAWEEMQALAVWRQDNGHWQARRAAQARHSPGRRPQALRQRPRARAVQADNARKVPPTRPASAAPLPPVHTARTAAPARLRQPPAP
jgi:putative protein kinase ArgK-like GTPase of G3E family